MYVTMTLLLTCTNSQLALIHQIKRLNKLHVLLASVIYLPSKILHLIKKLKLRLV